MPHFNVLHPSGSGSQDIRNVIPFSGKGFLLGGKSQSSASSSPSHQPAVPVAKASSPSPFSSPKNQPTTSPLAKTLSSPGHSGGGISSSFPAAALTGLKPPIKRSVGNTKVFVNINGSPVRIPKPSSGSSSQEVKKIKQRSIEELFSSTSFGKSGSQSSSSNAESKNNSQTSTDCSASSPRTSKPGLTSSSKFPSVVSSGSKGSPTKPTQSKYFNPSKGGSPSGATGGGQVSRKRLWDDRNSPATIFDFFQKTLGGESAVRRESVKTGSPEMQQKTAATTSSSSSSSASSLQSSAGLHNVAASSSSSAPMMVSCPVCQAKVQEAKINEHLDSCLS